MTKTLEIIIMSSAVTIAALFMLQFFLEHLAGRRSLGRAAKDTERVYDVLRDLVTRAGIARGLVVKVHNGGDNPTAYGQLYATILQEVVTGNRIALRKEYQKAAVDEAYIRMMTTVHTVKGKCIMQRVEDMDSGVLHDVYIKSNVNFYCVALIKTKRGASLVLSLQWEFEEEDFDPFEGDWLNVKKAEVREAVNKLRAIF